LFDFSFLQSVMNKTRTTSLDSNQGNVLYNGNLISNNKKQLKNRNSPFTGLIASKITCGICNHTVSLSFNIIIY